MSFRRDSTLTAVKIRGKRHGTNAEKWHTGKRRNPDLQKRLVSHKSPSPRAITAKMQRRRRHGVVVSQLSPMEQLPTEVLQQVFEYSANLDLPLVSRQLEVKLSKCYHLEHQLTSELLRPVLYNTGECVAAASLIRASRLLDSRFVTWSYFTSWLRNQSVPSLQAVESPDGGSPDSTDPGTIWRALQPSPALLPPRKLLRLPFTESKTEFLALLLQDVEAAELDPVFGELAHAGLVTAVKQSHIEMVSLLLTMNIHVDTELVRVAVIDSGCDKKIVSMLVDRLDNISDRLDPALWTWAERAHANGDPKGHWLLEILRSAQRSMKYHGSSTV